MKDKISIQEAEVLLNRYYEGLTTVDEENRLSVFMQQKDIPERFETDSTILGYFASEKKKPYLSTRPIIRWICIAAAVFGGLFCIKSFYGGEEENFAYINGEKITDVRVVRAKALNSLQAITSAPDEVQKSVSNLNDDILVQ